MLTAVVAALPAAVGLGLAALPIVLVPVALAVRRPPVVGAAFLGGWLLAVCVVGGVVIVLADVLELPGADVAWLSFVKVALGLLLLVLAVRKWRTRPKPDEVPEPPVWLNRVGTLTAGRAFTLAFALMALSPKNVAVVAGGATVIADATSVPSRQAVALVVFALVGSVGVGAPTAVVAVLGERAGEVLAAADRWMTRHAAAVVALVLAVLGVLLAVTGVSALVPSR